MSHFLQDLRYGLRTLANPTQRLRIIDRHRGIIGVGAMAFAPLGGEAAPIGIAARRGHGERGVRRLRPRLGPAGRCRRDNDQRLAVVAHDPLSAGLRYLVGQAGEVGQLSAGAECADRV